jgi:predicted flap endonuclease-1-like 5' DNA nuclease
MNKKNWGVVKAVYPGHDFHDKAIIADYNTRITNKFQEATMTKLIEIEGIGEAYQKKLAEAGVNSIESLLKAGATPKGRKELAAKSGITPDLILEWVNHCDLFRIKGVGSEYSDLLEEAGVDTVIELAKRKPENLLEKIIEVNESKKLVRRPPSLSMVTSWVEQAKNLPRAIEY